MASNIHEFQFAVSTCEEHSNEEVFSYCNTCQKKICELCVKGDHNSHDWSTISKYARKIRNEGTTISEQIMKEIVPALRSKTSRVRQESNSKDIIQTQQTLKESIDTYASQLLSAVVGKENDDEDIERIIGQFMKMSDFFKDNIHLAHDNVVLDMKEEFNIKKEEYRQFMKKSTGVRIFIKGSLLDGILDDIFGHLVIGNPDVKLVKNLVKSFTFGTDHINAVVATSKNKAWIHQLKSSKAVLLSKTGNQMAEVDFGEAFNYFTVKGRRYVFTCTSKGVVQEYADGKLRKVYTTPSHYPAGFCESYDGGLLVCFINCNQKDITYTTKGEVHHIDMTGNIISRYATDKDRKSALFIWPYRVAQNTNLDICVMDYTHESVNDRLVVVSVDGRLRFIYTGQPTMKKRFAGDQVVCDDIGRIFVSDGCNDAIHVLKSDGSFLQYIIDENDGFHYPCSFSIYEDTMWVVGRECAVSIYKIKQE